MAEQEAERSNRAPHPSTTLTTTITSPALETLAVSQRAATAAERSQSASTSSILPKHISGILIIAFARKKVWPWLCHNRIAVLGATATFAGFVLGLAALVPAFAGQGMTEEALELARWTALKDFVEQCWERKADMPVSEDCEKAMSASLPPPPNMDVDQQMDRLVARMPTFAVNNSLTIHRQSRSVWRELGMRQLAVLVIMYSVLVATWVRISERMRQRDVVNDEVARQISLFNSILSPPDEERGTISQGNMLPLPTPTTLEVVEHKDKGSTPSAPTGDDSYREGRRPSIDDIVLIQPAKSRPRMHYGPTAVADRRSPDASPWSHRPQPSQPSGYGFIHPLPSASSFYPSAAQDYFRPSGQTGWSRREFTPDMLSSPEGVDRHGIGSESGSSGTSDTVKSHVNIPEDVKRNAQRLAARALAPRYEARDDLWSRRTSATGSRQAPQCRLPPPSSHTSTYARGSSATSDNLREHWANWNNTPEHSDGNSAGLRRRFQMPRPTREAIIANDLPTTTTAARDQESRPTSTSTSLQSPVKVQDGDLGGSEMSSSVLRK